MKQETRLHNAANKQAAAVAGGHPTEYSTGGDFSTERVLGTGGAARVGPQDPNVAGGASAGYGSGNTY